MIWLSREEAQAVLVDTFLKVIIDGKEVYQEETICEMIAGEVKFGKKKIEEYYESNGKGKNTLINVNINENVPPEIIRYASDEVDGELKEIELEEGQGYQLIFKKITVTHPLEDVSISMFAVNDYEEE